MKRNKILLLFLFLTLAVQTPAQVDSRNRTPETVVADGLAQLPRAAHKDFDKLMSEFAATGEQGVDIIAGMLKPASDGKNATFEYALSGMTDYITTKEGSRYAAGVRKGLAKAVAACTDNANRAFLLSLLAKCATADDEPQIEQLLTDSYLADHAARALAMIPGIEDRLTSLVNKGEAPKAVLAKLAYYRQLKGTETTLISWLKGADTDTRAAILNALTVCGGAASQKLLASEAKKLGYRPDASGTVEAWLQLLERNTSDTKSMQKAAKALTATQVPAMRCAGLRLQMVAAGSGAQAVVLKALADADPQYRVTALDNAVECCGQGIVDALAANFDKLRADAKPEVMRWFGANHSAAAEAVVARCVGAADAVLSGEAMTAAAKIGSSSTLQALISQLGGEGSASAQKALLFFNGDIRHSVSALLGSGDAAKQKAALALVAQRHMTSAYQDVKRLTASADKSVSGAAYTAMQSIVTPAQFADVCAMLNSADAANAASLQKAAANAIASESGSKQYELTQKAMTASQKQQLYYPLLAQSGTREAITTLLQQKNDAADAALLQLDNSEMLPVLIAMVHDKPALKEKALARYLQLARKAGATAEERSLLLTGGLLEGPTAALAAQYVSALGQTRTIQALAAVAPYIDKEATAAAAAEAIKEIVGHNAAANGGTDVRTLLGKARKYYESKRAEDADAGYAVDMIDGLLAKTAATGYSLGFGPAVAEAGKQALVAKDAENFELTFNFNAMRQFSLIVRSMPLLDFDADKGVRLSGSDWTQLKRADGSLAYSTATLRVVDDRLFLTIDGKSVISNAVMHNPVKGKAINATGAVGFKAGKEAAELRNVCFNTLPSTPVYKLSADEAKQGFEVLFDGRSLEKWQGNTTNYTPQDGYIYVTAQYGGSGNLYTKKKYSDFVYRFEFCFEQPGVNNGIGIRTHIGTDAAYDGMEIQVLDHDDPIYAGLHPYQQHGSVYGIIVPKHVKFGKLGTWNTEEIRAVGDHITVTVNGEVILDGNIREACQGHNVAPDGGSHNPYTVDKKNHPGLFNRDGYVSFCGHGPGVKFRNVRILDLSKKKK